MFPPHNVITLRTLHQIVDEEDQLLLVANLNLSPVEQDRLAAMMETRSRGTRTHASKPFDCLLLFTDRFAKC